MPKVRPLQSVFTGGEISPKAYGRIQSDMYFQSLKRLRNFVVEPRGGVRDRPGMKKIINKTDAFLGSPTAIMIPFEIDGEGYVVWVEHHSVREQSFIEIIKGGSIIQTLGAPWEHDPSSGRDLNDLRWDYRDNVVYIVHPVYRPRRLEFSRTGGNFKLTTMDVGKEIFGTFNEDPDSTITVEELTNLNNGSTVNLTSAKGVFNRFHQGLRWKLFDGIVETNQIYSATEAQAKIIDNTNIAASATARWAPPGWSEPVLEYSYAWEQVSGDTEIVIDSPSSRTTTFSHDGTGTLTGDFRCEVTDDNGNSDFTGNVTVTIEHGVFEVTVPDSESEYRFESAAGTYTVTSDPVTADIEGGTSPFSYSWAKQSGDSITINSPTSQTTTFEADIQTNNTRTAIFTCTVTDDTGKVVESNECEVSLTAEELT